MNREVCEHGHWAGEDGKTLCPECEKEVAVWQRRQQAIAAVFVAAREVVEALECARFSHRMENRAVHNNVPECLHDCFPLVDLEDALKLYDSLGGDQIKFVCDHKISWVPGGD